MGSGSSWQLESEIIMSCIAMRHSSAATGGWSRFDTKTAAWAAMDHVLTEILTSFRKDHAAKAAEGVVA